MNIISKNIRQRAGLTVGDNSIVDDYSYFSANVELGNYSHIASNVTIAGGKEYTCKIGDMTSISSGVRIWCSSNDFVNDLIIIPPKDIGDNPICGDVRIASYCGIGSNTVIMPDNNIPNGVAIGAMSFVPARFQFEPWSVYAGIPIRKIKERNRKRVLDQVAKLL